MNDPYWYPMLDILCRLGASVLVGGLVGMERQIHGRWADLRTYMSVSVAAAIFVIAGQHASPDSHPDVTRIITGRCHRRRLSGRREDA